MVFSSDLFFLEKSYIKFHFLYIFTLTILHNIIFSYQIYHRMESTLFSRLDMFMAHKGLNDNRITVQSKIAVGTLGKQRRSGKGLSYDSIVKILRTYPELNPTWLILGDGEMLTTGYQEPINIKNLNELLKQQEALINDQHRKIELLISQLDYIRTLISENQQMLQRLLQK